MIIISYDISWISVVPTTQGIIQCNVHAVDYDCTEDIVLVYLYKW